MTDQLLNEIFEHWVSEEDTSHEVLLERIEKHFISRQKVKDAYNKFSYSDLRVEDWNLFEKECGLEE